MIDEVKRLLEQATGPDRELDCMLHEVLTGQLDQQTEDNQTCPRSLERAHGRMLLDLGSERRRYDVPCYTGSLEAVLINLIPKDFAVKLTMHPLSVMDNAKKLFGDCYLSKRFAISLHKVESKDALAIAGHDGSAALCACLVMVCYANGEVIA